jgi:hypothetical protein
MEFKNSMLMLIATVGTFILLYLLMFFAVPDNNAQILLAIVGPTLGFFFGSSVNKAATPAPPAGNTTNLPNNAGTITVQTQEPKGDQSEKPVPAVPIAPAV